MDGIKEGKKNMGKERRDKMHKCASQVQGENEKNYCLLRCRKFYFCQLNKDI